MGTSVQMIQQYYGKRATSAVFATRLGDQPPLRSYLSANVLSWKADEAVSQRKDLLAAYAERFNSIESEKPIDVGTY